MDEDVYRETWHELNDLPCPFEKAILRTCGACSQARRLHIAEREAVGCGHAGAQQRCLAVLTCWRRNAAFAVRLPQTNTPLPHGKEIRVQCGGLPGLQHALDPARSSGSSVADIDALLVRAASRYGDADNFPYEDIVRAIAHYKARRRG